MGLSAYTFFRDLGWGFRPKMVDSFFETQRHGGGTETQGVFFYARLRAVSSTSCEDGVDADEDDPSSPQFVVGEVPVQGLHEINILSQNIKPG